MNLAELYAAIDSCITPGLSDLAPDETTVNLYREQYPNLSRSTCERRLAKALAAGKITRRPARCNGRRCWAYKSATG